MVAGTQRKSRGTLEVQDHGRADVDPVRREGPYLVRVIVGSIVVGGFGEDTCQEGAVGMGDSAQVGVDGETARGEHQFGDLWAQEPNRAIAAVARCRRWTNPAKVTVTLALVELAWFTKVLMP